MECPHCKVGRLIEYIGYRFLCPVCPAFDNMPREKVTPMTEQEANNFYNNAFSPPSDKTMDNEYYAYQQAVQWNHDEWNKSLAYSAVGIYYLPQFKDLSYFLSQKGKD